MDTKRDALRLLDGLENGGLSTADAVALAEDLDPVLTYVIVSFLRAVYPAGNPAATAVLKRVIDLIASPAIVRAHEQGRNDPVAQWFESEYSYRDYRDRGPELVDLVADKLDS
jgi:hypothetical protein